MHSKALVIIIIGDLYWSFISAKLRMFVIALGSYHTLCSNVIVVLATILVLNLPPLVATLIALAEDYGLLT